MEKKDRGRGFVTLIPTVPKCEIEVTNFYTAYSYFYAPTFVFRGETHSAYELYYVNSGSVIVTTDKGEYELNKNNFFLFHPHEFHKMRANGVACNIYIISFDLKNSLPQVTTDNRVYTASPYEHRLMTDIVSDGMLFLAGKNYVPTLPGSTQPKFASGQRVKNLLELFLIEIVRSMVDNNEKPTLSVSGSENAILQLAELYMTENITRRLTLSEIASSIGYSIPHLCSIFKKNTGKSVMRWFVELKIKKARELIGEGKMTLKEISEYLDFDTIQYFSTQFKRVTGVTPSQFALLIKSQSFIIVDS